MERKAEDDRKLHEETERLKEKLKERMGRDRKRIGKKQMPRTDKPMLKKQEKIIEEDEETKAFKLYVGDLDQIILDQ